MEHLLLGESDGDGSGVENDTSFIFPVMSLEGVKPFTVDDLEASPHSSLNDAAYDVAIVLGEIGEEMRTKLRGDLQLEVFDYDDQQSINWQVCMLPATPCYGEDGPGSDTPTLPRAFIFRKTPGTDEYIIVTMAIFPEQYMLDRSLEPRTAADLLSEINIDLEQKQDVEQGVDFDHEKGRFSM